MKTLKRKNLCGFQADLRLSSIFLCALMYSEKIIKMKTLKFTAEFYDE